MDQRGFLTEGTSKFHAEKDGGGSQFEDVVLKREQTKGGDQEELVVGLCTDLAREQAERGAEGERMHHLEHICSSLEVNRMHVVSALKISSHQHSVFNTFKCIQDQTFEIELSGSSHLA